MFKPFLLLSCTIIVAFTLSSCKMKQETKLQTIPSDVLRDKIAGGWAGKMIGVSYGLSMIVILTLCPNFWVISCNDRSNEAILPIKIKYDIIF